MMNSDLKIFSILLSYPTEELQKTAPLLLTTLEELSSLDQENLKDVKALIKEIAEGDIYDIQENYVTLFDRTRSLSLHLFEHVHGESRDRGQAMVDLKEMYERAGFEIEAHELPDYLPMFLEFLSTRPLDDQRHLLSEILHISSAIGEKLKKRGSAYASIFEALKILSGQQPNEELLAALLASPEDDPNDLEALDKVWQEEAVTFGSNLGENDCGPDRLHRQIRAAHRDASTQV